MSSAFVEVAFPIPLNRAFHYSVPDRLRHGEGPVMGARVLAPFGKNLTLVGYVVGHTDEKPSFPTKSILECLDHEPFVDANLFELARWMSEKYLCSVGEALAAMVPPHLTPPKRPQEPESAKMLDAAVSRSRDLALSRESDARLLELSDEQERALAHFIKALDQKIFVPFVLRGITDSGKTELYLRTIDRAIGQGKQALFLLPEIALTPPFITRLKARYSPERVGLWHSGLTPNQRYATWMGIRRGEIDVILGARSAVFAPFPNLGVIVMDEEHEPTYKQEDRPRYHMRDVALKRAGQLNAILIMGSATPSLESYWNAKHGAYRLVELTSRVEQKLLPPVTLVDLRPPSLEAVTAPFVAGADAAPSAARKKRKSQGYQSVFSEPLKLAIEQRLARREQVMLFVNRRGFTPFLRCGVCGWVARCSRCSTTLAFHIKEEVMKTKVPKAGNRMPPPKDALLQCHACLHKEQPPIQCPTCKSMRLRQFGIGTQRVEQEVKRLFPFVRLARLDHDVASSRKVYEAVYNGFAGGEIDVLVGTQMIAKGFDFPGVTLVGVIDADVSLHLPEFRAAERTFQLVAQVAGRTGRGEAKGKVIVQTHHPEHYALQAAQSHDFLTFYNEEIGHREALRYPPFCRLVNILIRGPKEPVVQKSAEALYEKLKTLGEGVDILGPSPAPYARIRGQWRYQILLKGTEESLAPFISFLRHYRLPKAYMSVDVDPFDLL
jgi:primosomal protein N' (replication factor Y) (superfamily II helicase)